MLRPRPTLRALPAISLALSLLLTAVVAPLPVVTAEPAVIPQGPLPTGELKPVEFSFMTIDGTVSPTGDGTLIDARTRTRLKNPDKKASYDREVSFSGPPVSSVRIGTQNGGLQAAEGAGPWLLSLRPDGDAIIEGVQRLGIGGALADVQLDWGALAPWGSRLGAVRLTLHFPNDLDSEQLLVVDPEPTQRDATHLTWSYEKFKPAGTVHVALIAPTYWRPVRAARQATASPQAAPGDFLALAAALRPLARAAGMPPSRAGVLEAELLAALRGAVAAGPKEARTHVELAAYLAERAPDDPALRAQAVSELRAALDLAPDDAEVKKRLLAALDGLIAACRKAGDTRGVLAALDVAQAVLPQGSPERAAAYADLAVAELEAGRVAEAEAIIVAGFGQAALDRYAPFQPHFSALSGEVETRPGLRTLRFTLSPATGAGQAAQRDLEALAAAAGRTAQVERQEKDGRSVVSLSIPFTDAPGLQQAGLAVAASLPADADPALLLMGAAVGPKEIAFEASRGRRSDRLAYSEGANLAPAQEALARRLERLKTAQAEAETASDDPMEAARRHWALALLQSYEAGWRSLAAGCRVSYRILPPEDIVAPQWALAWGEQRALAWTTTIPRPERLWPFGVGIGVGLAALVAVFLVRRRRSGSP